jgi:hypothetical protein
MMEGSGAGSVLVTNGSGCGSGRSKNIRIRIRNTAFVIFLLVSKSLQLCIYKMHNKAYWPLQFSLVLELVNSLKFFFSDYYYYNFPISLLRLDSFGNIFPVCRSWNAPFRASGHMESSSCWAKVSQS